MLSFPTFLLVFCNALYANAFLSCRVNVQWSFNTLIFFSSSRTTVPLELRRQWTFWPDYTEIDPSSRAICVDGEIGTVNKTYREVSLFHLSMAYTLAECQFSGFARRTEGVVRSAVAPSEKSDEALDGRTGRRSRFVNNSLGIIN